jgi:hypothetical protein
MIVTVGICCDEDLMVSANVCENCMLGKSKHRAAQRVALLNTSFATDEGHVSIVEEPQVTFAAVMCRDVLPQDVPTSWLGKGLWISGTIDKVSTTLLQDCQCRQLRPRVC